MYVYNQYKNNVLLTLTFHSVIQQLPPDARAVFLVEQGLPQERCRLLPVQDTLMATRNPAGIHVHGHKQML